MPTVQAGNHQKWWLPPPRVHELQGQILLEVWWLQRGDAEQSDVFDDVLETVEDVVVGGRPARRCDERQIVLGSIRSLEGADVATELATETRISTITRGQRYGTFHGTFLQVLRWRGPL